jgi:hypothetical protein
MNPCIRLVFISGFSRDSLEAMGLAVPTYSLFLQKPVLLSALLDIFDAD